MGVDAEPCTPSPRVQVGEVNRQPARVGRVMPSLAVRVRVQHGASFQDDREPRMNTPFCLGLNGGERSSSPAPHEAKYVVCYAVQVFVIANFRHVLRRQVQRLVVRLAEVNVAAL